MPSDEELGFVDSEEALYFIERNLKASRDAGRKAADWKKRFPHATEQALDLLKGLLQFSPDKRLTVQQAIDHPYFENLRRDDPDLPRCEKKFDWAWEHKLDDSAPKEYPAIIRSMIWEESLQFHPLDQQASQGESAESKERSANPEIPEDEQPIPKQGEQGQEASPEKVPKEEQKEQSPVLGVKRRLSDRKV